MNIEIDIDDYLSDAEKTRLAAEAFREVAKTKAAKDFERILSNAGYELVRREVDAAFDGGMVDAIKAKATEVIKAMPTMTVFKRPDAWDREASKGWDHLQRAMDDAQPAIAARVNEIIAGMDSDFLHELIQDRIAVAIIEKLKG